MADPSVVTPPQSPREDPADAVTDGLDRLMRDVDGKPAAKGFTNGGSNGSGGGGAEAATTAAKFAQAFPSSAPAPSSQGGGPDAAAAAASAAAAAAAATAADDLPAPAPAAAPFKPYEPEARGSLVVSPPTSGGATAVDEPAAEAAPVVRLTSSRSPPPRVRKGGAKKMGARKLGAMKIGSGGGAVKLSGFDDFHAATPAAPAGGAAGPREDADLALARKLQEEEDLAAAVAAPSSRLAAAASAALAPQPSSTKGKKEGTGGSIYRSTNDSSSGTGGYGYRNGATTTTTSSSSSFGGGGGGGYGNGGGYGGGGGGSSTFDKDKYKNVKGIGSDMLFGARDDDPEEVARRAMKGQEFSQSAAISSDMYFDREVQGGGGGGGGGYDGGGGVGIADMADQVAASAAAELKNAAQAAGKLKVSHVPYPVCPPACACGSLMRCVWCAVLRLFSYFARPLLL